MTTIATDGKSMSADSYETADDIVVGFNVKKLHRLKDGSIVGTAGDVGQIKRLLKWLDQDDEEEEMPTVEDASALILRPDGTLELLVEGSLIEAEAPAAIGTGMPFALTAMDMGATPEQAVEKAILRDVFSGGSVKTLTLD